MVEKNTVISNKIPVIWALYDDAESCYMNAIKKYFHKKYEVHSIGINDKKISGSNYYFYHKIDLSILNQDLIKNLNLLPKPDYIFASPPCESWSGADCAGKMFRKITKDGHWEVKNKKYYDEYNVKCHPVKRRYFFQKEEGRILGEATIAATVKIIDKYKPKVWIIENPQTSKIWDFLENHWCFDGIKNLAYYSSYNDSYSKKPTYFKSNLNLDLKRNKSVTSNKRHMAYGSYSKRSSIPYELINEIILKIEEKYENK